MAQILNLQKEKWTNTDREIAEIRDDFEEMGFSGQSAILASVLLYRHYKLEQRVKQLEGEIRMSIFANVAAGIESSFDSLWARISNVFTVDVEPILKQFLKQFASADGAMILAEAMTGATALATGTAFNVVAGDVMKAVIAKSETLALQDASVTLQQVQSALQVAKVVGNITSPADTHALAVITAPVVVAPVEEPAVVASPEHIEAEPVAEAVVEAPVAE